MLIHVTLMGGLWPFGGGDRDQPKREDTIAGLEARELELNMEPTTPDGAALAREQYRLFLELSAGHPELRAEAMRRLADLSLQAGEDEQFGDLAVAESAFYRDAIELYIALLADDPAEADVILYQLGRAYDTIGETESALATLDRMVQSYPASGYFGEAQFRRGEILFVAKRYAEAEAAYAAVIGVGSQSSFYEPALYKHGWSLFKQSEHERSLDSFIEVLDRRLAGNEVDQRLAEMTKPERELVDDTFRVLGITFSYMDGAESVDPLLDRHGEITYADLLYGGLGDLYIDKERYIDAAKTYSAFVARHPTHSRSPELQSRVIDAYTLGKFPSLVLEAKRDFVELYGLDTAYWMERRPDAHPVVVAQLKQHLTDLAGYDHSRAQTDGDSEAYELAAGWYRRYLAYFPEDPDSGQRSFLLAEIYLELERFGEATDQYLDAAYGYGPHDKAAEAAYAAVLSGRKHQAQLDGDALTAWRARMIDESLHFADSFPAHEQAAPVRTKVAEELFAAGELDRAVQVAGLVVTAQPPATMELERTAWTVIAHAQFDLARYVEAEQAYRRLQLLPLADDTQPGELEERIAASVYRQAEQAQTAGEMDAAVEQFLRVADAAPGAAIVPTAVYDAAALLITNEQWPRAVAVLERFRAEFPAHEFQDDVTQKLAVARVAAGQPVRAAGEFERVATLASVDSELHREALWRAAELYEAESRRVDEIRVLAEIVQRFPNPLAESIEARQRLADLAGEAGDLAGRSGWLESIIDADASAGAQRSDRSQTLAARAALELAEPVRDAYYAVALSIPLKDSLKLKKSRMELALAAYGRAADYGVAEVATTAAFEIAELYYRLSRDLMDSERPAELNAEELEQYEILLEEQAFPFEEQAIDLFAANVSRTAQDVYDEAIRKSFARLAELMPARYAKSERSENFVTKFN
jgi:TolA-binding protein